MKYTMDTRFSDEELRILESYGCEIVPEISFARTDFAKNEIPQRMIKYGSTYIAEITDSESGESVWAVLSKWKGTWHSDSYYDSLEALMQGI